MISWIYPERCPVCLRPVMPKGAMIHPECKDKVDLIKEPVCMKCGMPLSNEEQEYCTECTRNLNRGWDKGRSLFPYHGAMGRALWFLKNEGTTEFVRFFVNQITESQMAFISRCAPECIVPVPLHPAKQRRRGFNQSELLAEALGEALNIPVRLLLIKHKKTKDQKNLSRALRKKNVKDAFAVNEEAMEEQLPSSVLLLDDVSTTGSTLTACADLLKAQGVKKVAFISIFVAEQPE